MKDNLKILLFFLSVLCAVSTSVNLAAAQEPNTTTDSTSLVASGTKEAKEKELQAFFNSKYNYWDARILADYWGQSLVDAKARIGRKVLWGSTNVAILEQFLVDARVSALQSVGSASDPSSYRLYGESRYTYEDAQALARFWGDPSPTDTKLRIVRNLILGNQKIVDQALRYARSANR
jgi:hypothetical protein